MFVSIRGTIEPLRNLLLARGLAPRTLQAVAQAEQPQPQLHPNVQRQLSLQEHVRNEERLSLVVNVGMILMVVAFTIIVVVIVYVG
jgi:hypothetical protein